MKTKILNNLSVKKEVFFWGIFLTFVSFVFFGILLSVNFYIGSINSAKDLISERTNSISIYTDGFFKEIINTVEFLSKNFYVINGMQDDKNIRDNALKIFQDFLDINDNILYVYSGYEDGSLLINDYTPPEGFDSRKRPWYQAAKEEMPSVSYGVPYLEAVSNEWVIAPSKALINEEGDFVGAVAIDSCLKEIARLLKERHIFRSQRSYILDENAKVIIHSDENYIGLTVEDIFQKIDKSEGEIDYDFENQRVIAYYNKIPTTGWIMITAVNYSEILNTILIRIALYLIAIIFVSIILGIVLYYIISKRFVKPIDELSKRVVAVTSGQSISESSYKYSNPEIASIADSIEKLTKNSLNRKASELETIIESTESGLLVINEQNHIIYINSLLKKMFNLEEMDILNKTIDDFIKLISVRLTRPDYFNETAHKLLHSNHFFSEEITLIDDRILEYYSRPFIFEDKISGRLWGFKEITERIRIQKALLYSLSMQKLLMKIASNYINIPLKNVNNTIKASLREIGDFVNADRVYIYDYNFKNNTLTKKYEWCNFGISEHKIEESGINLMETEGWIDLHKNGLPVYISNTSNLSDENSLKKVLKSQSIKSLLSYPILLDNSCIGFIGFDSVGTYYHYSEKEAKLLELFSQVLINIRERIKLQNELVEMEKINAVLGMSVTANHEINQPLMIIQGSFELLKSKFSDKEFDKYYSKIEESILRIEKILKKLKELEKVRLEDYAEDTYMVSIDD